MIAILVPFLLVTGTAGSLPSEHPPSQVPEGRGSMVRKASGGPMRLGSFDDLVPSPTTVEVGAGSFAFSPRTVIAAAQGGPADDAIALFRSSFGVASGLDLPVRDAAGGASAVVFTEAPAADVGGSEGYELSITPTTLEVRAAGHDGFVWAVQTLLQALPPEALARTVQPGSFALPTATVRDAPRYAWRGAMLDVARHFFSPAEVRAFIDEVSAYKLNRLHLHLTDDQGWRIEIRSHPDLTRLGGATEIFGGPGGSYTQDEYRGLIEYARRRGVTVVPEIDVPGHTFAALHSIPDLNCDGKPIPPYTGSQVGLSSLCVDKAFTYTWFDDVIGELAAMTPGPWIHIGGDESHATEPDAYRLFVERALGIVATHGKVPIGWEDVGRAVLPSGTIAQHWMDPATAELAADQGAPIILSPATRTYLDMRQTPDSPGLDWAGVVTTERAYSWDPASILGIPPSQVLGVEAPVWSEIVFDLRVIQERTLPRLPALAEVGWTSQPERNWRDFRLRIAAHAARWEVRGWAWFADPEIPWPDAARTPVATTTTTAPSAPTHGSTPASPATPVVAGARYTG